MVENFTELPRGEKRKIRNVSDELSQLLDLTAVDPHVGFFLQAMKGGIHLLQKSHQNKHTEDYTHASPFTFLSLCCAPCIGLLQQNRNGQCVACKPTKISCSLAKYLQKIHNKSLLSKVNFI